MKKLHLTAIISVLAAALVIAGCTNAFSPSASTHSGRDGNVTVSLAGGNSARVVLPSALDFDLYEFTFTNINNDYEQTFPKVKGSGDTFSFSVPTGPGYVLNVEAYKGAGENKILAAKGTSSVFTVDASTSVTVKLTGNLTDGTGTFSYTIQFPAWAQVDCMALVAGEYEEDLLAGAAASVGEDVTIISSSIDVQSGWYWLELKLSEIGGDREFVGGDLVSIYSNTITFYGTAFEPVEFTEDNFSLPGVETSEPVRVYYWHGFDVEGTDEYYNSHQYQRSYAVGTRYQTYTDATGTYHDVLKLEASSPFVGGAMMLTRPIIEAGTYTLSMDYFLVKGTEEPIVFWYNMGGSNPVPPGSELGQWRYVAGSEAPTPQGDFGKWLHMEGTFPLKDHEEIGIIARNTSNDYGLKDATIYIKNLKLLDTLGVEVPTIALSDLIVMPEQVALIPGGSISLDTHNDVNWYGYDSNIITVDSGGKVTAKTTGTTTITASLRDDPGVQVQIPVKVINKGAGSKYIAFTFDDGPDPVWTPRFEKVLSGLGAQATFFCIGQKVDAYPEVALANSEAGNEIGNHTYYHTMALQHESVDFIRAELERTQISIKNATGKDNKVFRGPALQYSHFGDIYAEVQYGENLEEAARQLGLALIDGVGHQAANFDYSSGLSAEYIANRNANEQAKEWGILLMHDGWPDNVANTYKALPILVEKLYAQGYEILTVSQLAEKRKLAGSAADLEPGRIYYDLAKMPEHVSSIAVESSGNTVEGTIELEGGQSITLTAVIAPEGAAVQEVYWYSDNSNVASVDNGTVTANNPGTTTIRVAAGGMRAIVTVTVNGEGPGPDPIGTITEWVDTDRFDRAGKDGSEYHGSRAVVEICDGCEGYDNVLKLSPPDDPGLNGNYYYGPKGGSVALTYDVAQSGVYVLSMDVWINPAEDVVVDNIDGSVDLLWYACYSTWPEFKLPDDSAPEHYNTNVPTGEWITRTGVLNVPAGITIGLLAHSPSMKQGLHGATIYIKNFKLELAGAENPIIDIPSTPANTPSQGSPGVTLEWDDSDFGLLEKSMIVQKNVPTIIEAPLGYYSYEWRMDGATVQTGTGNSYTFTGTEVRTCMLLLWVNGREKGASIEIIVTD